MECPILIPDSNKSCLGSGIYLGSWSVKKKKVVVGDDGGSGSAFWI